MTRSIRLDGYKQGFGADIFDFGTLRVLMGWGLLAPQVATAQRMNGTEVVEVLRTWVADELQPYTATQAVRELGYDEVVMPPWLAATVNSADAVR